MAPILKRKQPDSVLNRARKKFRSDQRGRGDPEQEPGLRTVSLESLQWHQVPFPATFQDAEGFFGLEELSDVDVVKDSSKIEYRLSSDRSKSKDPKGRNDSNVVETGTGDHDKEAVDCDDEWQGFEGSDSSEQEKQERPSRSQGASSRSQTHEHLKTGTLTRGSKSGKEELVTHKQPPSAGNSFDLLGKNDEREEGNDGGDTSAWESLDLSPELLSSLGRLRFSHPTPIQASALPHILDGHDAICKAPTGSGKTLAFGIPIYEHFLRTTQSRISSSSKMNSAHKHFPIALILSPTRELAHQLSDHLSQLSSNQTSHPLGIATLTGGMSVHKQQRLLATADVIIGTPGRLWEIMQNSSDMKQSLKSIRFLVLDEADRLLSSGHFQEVEEILNALDQSNAEEEGEDEGVRESQDKEQRQTLVFSATFQKDLQQRLAGKSKSSSTDTTRQQSMEYLLKRLNFREPKPRFIDVNPVSQMALGLKEGIVECAGTEKDLYLYSLLLHHPHTRTLIFTNSITSVRRLTLLLQNLSLPAYALHSQMPMKARLRSVERFSTPSSSSILVATDVAARGLDIPSVRLVVHYHLPRAADMYVHRSGRTARAEKSGSSILLCAPEEIQGVRRLIAKVHARNAVDGAENKKSFMRTIELDRRVVARVKPRVVLSKKISDHALANEKKGHEDNWLKTAAEDLGVEYDSEEFAAGEGSKKGRGQGRKKREKEVRNLTKDEVGALRAELKGLLVQRVNVGVSERYLTAGGVDIDELLGGERKGEFLGKVEMDL